MTVNWVILYRRKLDVLEMRELMLDQDDISGFQLWLATFVQGTTAEDNRCEHSMIDHASTEAPMQDAFATKLREYEDEGFRRVYPTSPQAE